MALDDDLLKELNGSDLEDDLASLLDQMVGADTDNEIEKQLDAEEDLSGLDNLLGDYDDIFGMMNSLEEEPASNQNDEEKQEQKDGFFKKVKESRAQKKFLKSEKKKLKKNEKAERKKAKKESKENSKKKKGSDLISEELELDLVSELNSMQPELANLNTEPESSLDMDLFSSAKTPDLDALDKKSELDDIEERPSKKKGKKEKKEKKEKKKKELSPKEKQELELKKAAKEQRRAEDRADVVKIKILDILLGVTVVVAIVCITYFGSLAFSYHHKMKQATNYFVEKNYLEAYELVGGLEVKEKDQGFYNQLVCVMRVERSTKEFQSFYRTGVYEEALNCLLVGVKNYEENLSDGIELGAEEPLKTSYGRILTLLSEYYGMTEADAKMITNARTRKEYQELVQSRAKNVKIVE